MKKTNQNRIRKNITVAQKHNCSVKKGKKEIKMTIIM